MKKTKRILAALSVIVMLICVFPTSVLAVTEGDVEGQVAAQGRDAVAGNLFVWVLCAISFLKISQKIDSFMSSLGINVGHTGGSMLGEAMIAVRGLQLGKGVASGFRGGGGGSGGGSSAGASGGLLSSGLAGAVGRQFSKGAMTAATGQGSGGIGGRMFASSMSKGGGFANNVIGGIAQGSLSYTGSMSGDGAAEALTSYMGYTGQADAPGFSDVEIGGGRITGTETTPESPNGIGFGMYHTDQYAAPSGDYSTLSAADGSKWYKQYAGDQVDRSPFMAPDGSISYKESIVQKLPDPPRRKDRL